MFSTAQAFHVNPELRCAVAESRNLSESIARAEHQRSSATYYRERFSDNSATLPTSEFLLLESKRSGSSSRGWVSSKRLLFKASHGSHLQVHRNLVKYAKS